MQKLSTQNLDIIGKRELSKRSVGISLDRVRLRAEIVLIEVRSTNLSTN